MKSINYLVGINIDVQITTVFCWDIKKNNIFPLHFSDNEEGIYPTVLLPPRAQVLKTNFFGRVEEMKHTGDLPFFLDFVKFLYKEILLYNKFLDMSNFTTIVSYPTIWSNNEGGELLKTIHNIIPNARYAVREDVILNNGLNNDDCKETLIIQLGESRTICATAEYIDVHRGIFTASLSSIVLENIYKGNYYDVDKEIIELFLNNEIQKAELFLRKKINFILSSLYTSPKQNKTFINDIKWINVALNNYCNNFEILLKQIKNKNVNPSFIELWGDCSIFVIESVKKKFPSAKIKILDSKSICIGILEIMRTIYEDVNECINELCADKMSYIENNEVDQRVGMCVQSIIRKLWDEFGLQYLTDNYININDIRQTTYCDFRSKVEGFIKEMNTIYLGKYADLIKNKVIDELNSFFQEIVSYKLNTVNEVNDISDYFELEMLPVYFEYMSIHDDLKVHVFNYIHDIVGANVDNQRNYKERVKVTNRFMEYTKEYTIVNYSPVFSWELRYNIDVLRLYFMDSFIMLKNNIEIVKSYDKKCHIGLDDIRSNIIITINKLVEEGIKKIYEKIGDDALVFKEKSSFDGIDHYCYDSYVMIKKLDENRNVKLGVKGIKNNTVLKPRYSSIHTRLKKFFDVDINYWKQDKMSIDEFYNLIIQKYLTYRKEYKA